MTTEQKTLKNYFLAARPWSFSMSFISVLIGALSFQGNISFFWLALTVLGVVFFHAGGNIINDYYDSKNSVDKAYSSTAIYRIHPILSGLMSPKQLFKEAWFFLILAGLIGLSLAMWRSPHVLWIGAFGLLGTVFYTGGDIKYKYRALGELGVFIIWGPLMVQGAYVVQSGELSLSAFLVSLAFGMWVALVLFSNNIRDIDSDTSTGIATLAIVLGKERSFKYFTAFLYASYAYVLLLVILRVSGPWLLVVFLSLPKSFKLLKTFSKNFPDAADALTAQSSTLFGVLLLAGLILNKVLL